MYHQPNRLNGGLAPRRCFAALLATLGLAVGTSVPQAQAEPVDHAVSAGLLKVDQNGDVSNTNVVVTSLISINGFQPIKADWSTNTSGVGFLWWNTADYYVQIGADSADDVAGGILMSSVAQNGRENIYKDTSVNPDGDFYLTNAYPISAVSEQSNSKWRIVSYRNPTQSAGSGEEFNVNVAGAWFPYSKYIGALVRNSGRTNGGLNNTIIGHPSLVLGTHYKEVSGGKYIVDLTSLGIDSRTDGVLLVNHGKDENNFALSGANATNGSWNVWTKDMAQPTFGNAEQDPLAFVYIPKTNTSLISGKFNGDGSIAIFSGDAPKFNVSVINSGRFLLKIDGHSANSGVLIITPEVGGALNGDNIVNYEPTVDGWEIQSRDTPGMGLQTPVGSNGEPEPVCSFVFVPAPTPSFQVTPSQNLLTTEAGGIASFNVFLDAAPTANVTIPVSSSDTSEGIVSVSSLVFTPDNWDVPQTVTVTGQDDALADSQVAYTIVLGAAVSADTRYNGMNPQDVSVLNADNEAGITFSASQVTTTEAGGTAEVTVVLNTAPTANVTVNFTSSDTTEGTVLPASVTFTPADWSTPYTLVITGVNDLVDDGDVQYSIVTSALTSTDPAYNGLDPLDIAAVNIDNDQAGLVLSKSDVTVSETGTTETFTVVLTSQPTANVVVNLTSSNTAEGTVSPATMTFTPANWNTPQTATITGVDDFTNNGQHEYTIQVVATGADAVYAALPASVVTARTTDNEGQLDLASDDVWYGIGSPAIGIDGAATLVDSRTSYNSGSLTVTIASAAATDVLAVRNEGTLPGQIGVAGSTLSYEGVNIGTISGGTGAPLVIQFNAASNPTNAQAVMRAVTYRSTGTDPVRVTRNVTFALNNGVNGVSSDSKTIHVGALNVFEFQNGRDAGFGVYNGSADIQLHEQDATGAPLPTGESATAGLWLDYEVGDRRQVLMRFHDIIGSGPGKIPANAKIISAELVLDMNDSGNGAWFYRMLIPFDATNDTFISLGDGVSVDNVEAVSTPDVIWGSYASSTNSSTGAITYNGSSGTGSILIGVTPDVQAWVNGATNEGWMLEPWYFGTDGLGFSPSEATNIVDRPMLRVKWVPADTQEATFRQGVNGYAGTHDTQVRKTTPDNNYATANNLAVDYEVTSEALDPQMPLIRFDDIIGSAAGQIPANALIHSAVLELSSTTSDSVGDGGLFHAMLQPWDDTVITWNTAVDGISANGVEAAVEPSFVAGNATRSPDVQSAVNYFDATADVQAWVAGTRQNYGWALLPWMFGGNGWGFNTAEALEQFRPRLKVYFSPGALPENIVLQAPVVGSGTVQLNFTGTAGRAYTIKRTGSLVGGTWSDIGTATANASGAATFTDNSPLAGAGFYRVAYP